MSEKVPKFVSKEYYNTIWRDMYNVRKYPEDSFDFIFDVGALTGAFSLFMRMRHPSAKIIAMEPDPRYQESLRMRLVGLNIISDNRALGDGSTQYFLPREASNRRYFRGG